MAPRESLKEILDVRPTASPEKFSVVLENFWGKPVVGDLLARLVLAAHAAGESAPLRSLQTTLARSVPADTRLDVHVRRDSGICRFDVERSNELVCVATARFSPVCVGPDYQQEHAPAAPRPETLPSTVESARSEGWPEEYARGPFEFRRVGPRVDANGNSESHVTWLRPRNALPHGAHWHTAALLFASEFYSHWAFEWRLGTMLDVDAYTPLEHSIWLHGAPRFDDWVLIVATSQRASNGYAVARRSLFATDGSLIASAMHSGLVSRRGEPA